MSADDDKILSFDFPLSEDPPGRTPEQSRRRRAQRADQAAAASQRYLAAELDGRTHEQALRAARAGAARVSSLDAAATRIEAAMADLVHLGEHHPARVLLAAALDLVEREEISARGGRRPS